MDILLERILSLIPRKPDGKFVHGAISKFGKSIGYNGGEVIAQWMAGQSDSYKKKVNQIAETYNVSAAWLMGETDKKEKPAPTDGNGPAPLDYDDAAMLDAWRNAPETTRQAIRLLLKF